MSSLREEFVKDLSKALDFERYARLYNQENEEIKRKYNEIVPIIKEIIESGKIYNFQKKLLRKILT